MYVIMPFYYTVAHILQPPSLPRRPSPHPLPHAYISSESSPFYEMTFLGDIAIDASPVHIHIHVICIIRMMYQMCVFSPFVTNSIRYDRELTVI